LRTIEDEYEPIDTIEDEIELENTIVVDDFVIKPLPNFPLPKIDYEDENQNWNEVK